MELALVLPSHAEELRDRLNWEAPPALVADFLIREAVDRNVSDPRCLKARMCWNLSVWIGNVTSNGCATTSPQSPIAFEPIV